MTKPYGLGIITQVVIQTNTNRTHSAAFYIIWVAVAIALACIPATIASQKGRPFALWFLFGFFCWLPALIVALVISDTSAGTIPGPGYTGWNVPPPPPNALPPAGWYPDPGGAASQRYWDGFRWTEHTQ